LEERIKKAHERLKEFEIFSDDFETFKNFFYENLVFLNLKVKSSIFF
jgi:hypothetical protein